VRALQRSSAALQTLRGENDQRMGSQGFTPHRRPN
jgi:hypothetical protein